MAEAFMSRDHHKIVQFLELNRQTNVTHPFGIDLLRSFSAELPYAIVKFFAVFAIMHVVHFLSLG